MREAEEASMRRIVILLTAAAVMTAMLLVVIAVPALKRDNLTVTSPSDPSYASEYIDALREHIRR